MINGVIPRQNYELVLDRIGSILKEELDNQSEFGKVSIFKERHVPFNSSQLPALNVMMETADYAGQDVISTQGTYVYIIEGQYAAPDRVEEGSDKLHDYRGDTRSMVLLQRLMGVVRAILENPIYYTLGFIAPSIGNRHVARMYFMKQINQDTSNVMLGRVIFSVRVHETSNLIDAPLIKENTTRVKLDLTDQGYQWVFVAP